MYYSPLTSLIWNSRRNKSIVTKSRTSLHRPGRWTTDEEGATDFKGDKNVVYHDGGNGYTSRA